MSEALSSSGSKGNKAAKLKIDDDGLPPVFIGPPIPDDEARKRWPNRYLALKAILHPEQDRVLSIRENARLQGFPDYYKLSGPVKERYIQVGNAVAVPVSRSLGYALGLAIRGISDNDEPLFTLPKKFPYP